MPVSRPVHDGASDPLRGPLLHAPPKIIAVAGTMGAGKSSLVDWLSKQFGMVPYFEPNDENPYLADFYQDMKRWAFSSQLFFLIRRFQIHRRIAAAVSPESVRGMQLESRPVPAFVQDRTLYEDAEIFAAHLHTRGFIDDRDYKTYTDLYETLKGELRPPDLMIYLRCPLRTLTRRIQRRGRSFEKKVPKAYLAELEDLYETWFARYDLSPALVIETDRVDYVERLFDRLEVVEAIQKHVFRK